MRRCSLDLVGDPCVDRNATVNRRQRRRRDERRKAQVAAEARGQGEWLTDRQALPLLWRPWYLETLDNLGGAVWVWSITQAACALPDPVGFPAFEVAWTPEQVAMLTRYAQTAERLTATSVLNDGGTIKIDLMTGTVDRSLPADDATLGFAALLRQCFKDAEEASFDRVRKTLARGAHTAGEEEASQVLAQWKAAHRTLQRKHLRALLHQLAVDAGYTPSDGEDGAQRAGIDEEITPRELIEVFLYGDMLHWGEGRDRLREWAATERGAAEVEFEMRTDAHALGHFYAGFASVVRQCLPTRA